MASGRAAVLAGDNPGYRSVMEPREDLLFNPMSADALAELLAEHIKDAAKRQNAAKWGEDYTKRFDVVMVGERLVKLYSSALHKRRQ